MGGRWDTVGVHRGNPHIPQPHQRHFRAGRRFADASGNPEIPCNILSLMPFQRNGFVPSFFDFQYLIDGKIVISLLSIIIHIHRGTNMN